MGLTLHSPSLSLSLSPFSFCPLLADRPLPPQVTLKRSGVNGPAFAYCRQIKMTLFGVIFVDTPSSSWPLRHLYSLLPRGLFLLRPQAPTRVNGRVHNPVGLFKLPSLLTHFCAAETLMYNTHTDAQTLAPSLLMRAFLRCCIEFIFTNWIEHVACRVCRGVFGIESCLRDCSIWKYRSTT